MLMYQNLQKLVPTNETVQFHTLEALLFKYKFIMSLL